MVVLGVMNGFQLGFIDSILQVSSYHVRVNDERKGGIDEGLIARILAEPGVESVLPFAETRCLLTSKDGGSFPILIKAIPDNSAQRDPGMFKTLGIQYSQGPSSDWSRGGGITLGAEMASYLGLTAGSSAELLVVSAGGGEGVESKAIQIHVDGTFRSGYYDFDFGMAIVPFSSSICAEIFPQNQVVRYVYGIKLRDRFADAPIVARLESDLMLGADRVESWRDYNRAFFGALRTEKTVMMILIGLIFLVVGVNIFHSMRRAVAEKTEDIAVLKAMGASDRELRSIFFFDGLAIGTGGAFIGLAIGLLIAVNVNEIFAIVETAVNGIAGFVSHITGSFGVSPFRVFSPQYFYLIEVPVRVLFPETLVITMAAIASSAAAAAKAAARVSGLAPAEVLRYE